MEQKSKTKDLNALKQELEMDEHKIPIAELYRRLGTNPDTVSVHKTLVLRHMFQTRVGPTSI